MKNIPTFIPSYASFSIGWHLNYDQEQIEVLSALGKSGRLPYGYLGGKESLADGKNPLVTLNREWEEEGGITSVNPREFYIDERKNDDGSGISFPNYFHHSQERTGSRREPRQQRKDSIKKVEWVTLEEAFALPMKMSHRGATIEFCYFLEETMKDNAMVKAYLKKLHYRILQRPSMIQSEDKVQPTAEAAKHININGPAKYFEWHRLFQELQACA